MAKKKPAPKRKNAPTSSKRAVAGKAKVTADDVRKVASVARLKLSDSELGRFAGELEKILEAFGELEKIDTLNVKPSFQPVEVSNVLREDKVKPSLTQEKATRNAKNREAGFVKGPRVV